MMNKKVKFAALLMTSITFFSCNKNVKNNEYISECANINSTTHSSMTARNNACKDCCAQNGWDNGIYDEGVGASQEGCECIEN